MKKIKTTIQRQVELENPDLSEDQILKKTEELTQKIRNENDKINSKKDHSLEEIARLCDIAHAAEDELNEPVKCNIKDRVKVLGVDPKDGTYIVNLKTNKVKNITRDYGFGWYFTKHRRATRKTLKQFCLDNRLDPVYISKLERSKISPPQDTEVLENFAKLLNIKNVEYFIQLAQLDKDLKFDCNEEELLNSLPAIPPVCPLDRNKDEFYDSLINKIRKA